MTETSASFPMGLLPSETVILETRPSPQVAYVWLFTKALPSALVFSVFAMVAWMLINEPPARGMPHPYPATSGFFFVGAIFFGTLLLLHIYNVFLARTYLYRITSHRFIFTGGIFRKRTHAVEHRRVTDVQYSQNLIEQALSLGCVHLPTPGSTNGGSQGKNRSMPELRLEGLVAGEKVFEAVSDSVRRSHGPAV